MKAKIFPSEATRIDNFIESAEANLRRFTNKNHSSVNNYGYNLKAHNLLEMIKNRSKSPIRLNNYTDFKGHDDTDRNDVSSGSTSQSSYYNHSIDADTRNHSDDGDRVVEFVNNQDDSDDLTQPNSLLIVDNIEAKFKLLTNQITDMKQKLESLNHRLLSSEKDRANLKETITLTEEENVFLRQKLIYSLEGQQKRMHSSHLLTQSSDQVQSFMKDIVKRKRLHLTNDWNQTNGSSQPMNKAISNLLTHAQYNNSDEMYVDMNNILSSAEPDETSSDNIIRYLQTLFSSYIPYRIDIRQIEGRLGSSVASYFIFLRYLIIKFSLLCILILVFAWYHVGLILHRKNYSLLYNFDGFLLKFMLYSSFDVNEGSFYSWCLVGTIILLIVIAITKLLIEDKRKKMIDSYEKINSTPFSKEILCGWDLTLITEDEINDYSLSLTHQYNQLLDDSYIQRIQMNRTRYEQYQLQLRRLIGFLLYILVQTLSVSIILYINVNSTNLIAIFNKYTTIITSLTLGMINSTMPYILQYITTYEQWDYPDTEVNVLLIRMYLSSIMNLSIIAFSYLLLANPTLISNWSLFQKLQVLYKSQYDCRFDQVSTGLFILFITDFMLRFISVFVTGYWNIMMISILDYVKQSSWFTKSMVPLNDRSSVRPSRVSTVIQSTDPMSNNMGYNPIKLVKFNINRISSYCTYLIFSYKRKSIEFELPINLVALLELVGKAFLLFPFNPISFILLPILLHIRFKWEKVMMVKYYSKPRRPWKPSKAIQVFTLIYLSTVLFIALPMTIAFLALKSFPKSCMLQDEYLDLCLTGDGERIQYVDGIFSCAYGVDTSSKYYRVFGDGTGSNSYPNNICSDACGAFVDSRSAWSVVKDSLVSVNVIQSIYEALFDYPYLPWFCVMILIVYIALYYNTIYVKVMSHLSVEKILETKILTLEAENMKQSKLITRLKAVDDML